MSEIWFNLWLPKLHHLRHSHTVTDQSEPSFPYSLTKSKDQRQPHTQSKCRSCKHERLCGLKRKLYATLNYNKYYCMFQTFTNTCPPSNCAGGVGDVQQVTRKATNLLLLVIHLLMRSWMLERLGLQRIVTLLFWRWVWPRQWWSPWPWPSCASSTGSPDQGWWMDPGVQLWHD